MKEKKPLNFVQQTLLSPSLQPPFPKEMLKKGKEYNKNKNDWRDKARVLKELNI